MIFSFFSAMNYTVADEIWSAIAIYTIQTRPYQKFANQQEQ